MPDYILDHEIRLLLKDCRTHGHKPLGFICERCGALVDVTKKEQTDA